MKQKFEYFTENSKEFFFASDRSEAEKMILCHYGISANLKNLHKTKYQIIN